MLQCAAVCSSVLQCVAVVQHGRVLLDRVIRVVHQKSLEIHQKSPTFNPKRPAFLKKGSIEGMVENQNVVLILLPQVPKLYL